MCVCDECYQFSWLNVLPGSFFWENISSYYESMLHKEAPFSQHQHGSAPRHFPTVAFEDRLAKPRHAPISLSTHPESLQGALEVISSPSWQSTELFFSLHLAGWCFYDAERYVLFVMYSFAKIQLSHSFRTEISTPGHYLAHPSFQLWGGTWGVVCSTLTSLKRACMLKWKPGRPAMPALKLSSQSCCCSEIKYSSIYNSRICLHFIKVPALWKGTWRLHRHALDNTVPGYTFETPV